MAGPQRNAWFPTTTRWTEDDGRVALDAWKRSGLGAHAFAREHGITAQRWVAPRRGNLYQFSLNNPLRYMDPDGRDVKQDHSKTAPTCNPCTMDAGPAVYDTSKWAKREG